MPGGDEDGVNGKLLVGATLVAGGCALVVVGLLTMNWVVGSTIVNQETVDHHVGVFRTQLTFTSTTTTTTTGGGGIHTTERVDERVIEFDNQGNTLDAGETAVGLSAFGLILSFIALGTAFVLSIGRMPNTVTLGHSIAIWCSFGGGLAFVIASIAYSAVFPKLEQTLSFGWSFIMVLAGGFVVLIGGLVFVLTKQEAWMAWDQPLAL
eukprot:TRINITY_DN66104_c6_g2_i1.p3 TRINITY_DN66104_c6_g2~~TRINITY_DN66104_c6_g2_i1.p3  ORF type:complete len:208 (+),score=94.79 TRINITY_DN66104_c6_g2_i1:106-729(+)